MNTNVRVGLTYITFGIICFAVTCLLIYQRHNPSRVAFSHAPETTITSQSQIHSLSKTKESNMPVRITSKSLGLDVSVFSSSITKGVWETSSRGVSYLASTPMPGFRGNSILYGHNWPGILGNLTKAKPGDSIEITSTDGLTRQFIVEKTAILDPSDYKVLLNTTDTRITIYTCTGFLDRKRFVATARLVDTLSVSVK